MGKDTTLRLTSEAQRMLGMIHGWDDYKPSLTVNEAIEATPDKYLERKPTQLHIQLSDSAIKKLNKARKKYKLSNATLIERAIDAYYKITVMKRVKQVAAKVDEIVDKKEQPFHPAIDDDMRALLRAVLPIDISFYPTKPYWRLSHNALTTLVMQSE